jgi:glycosyltransferase involved in cell wall biosynthesis
MGHEVTVYCRSYFTPPLPEYHGMRLVRLPTIRTKHLDTLVHTMLSTTHALFHGCDIVHYHALGPALFASIPRLFGRKTVVTVQGQDWRRKKWKRIAAGVLRLGERAAVRLPNATMVVSRTLQEQYRALYSTETSYVPNGTTIRKCKKASQIVRWGIQPGNYILFLGRFSPEKNCHLLVQAYERIDTPVTLVMAGGSSYSDAYAQALRRHSSDRIRLLDWVSGPELEELLTNAMLFALPSDLEGLSLALLDAMGAGVCVLASDIPENQEVLQDAGFIFKQRVRQHYLWPQIAQQIDGVYRSLAEPKTVTQPSSAQVPSPRPESSPNRHAA